MSKPRNLITKAMSLIHGSRLPWRMSQWLYNRKLYVVRSLFDHKVLSTRAYITGKDNPHFEVHVLLGHTHIGMCLWSVKSFLHYSGHEYTVVLHDDGSITESDEEILTKHLVGVRVIRKIIADDLIRDKLSSFPNCLEYRFLPTVTTDHRGDSYNMRIFALRLFDFNLLSDASKILVLDADVMFFKTPREICEWADNPKDIGSLYSVEQYVPRRNIRYKITGFDSKTSPPNWANAGLLCFDKHAYSLDMLEQWIGRDKDMMGKYPTFEQRMYNLLLIHGENKKPLSDAYTFNYTDNNVVATHFAIKHLFFSNIPRIQKELV